MKIIPLSFTARDCSDFESVLNLAASRLTRQWTLGDPTELGDFHIIALGQPDELATFLADRPGVDLERVIVYAGEEGEAMARWKIVRREGSPPRLSELIAVLNDIAGYLNGLDCAKPRPDDIPPTEAGGDNAAAETAPVEEPEEEVPAIEDDAKPGMKTPPTLLARISRFFTG